MDSISKENKSKSELRIIHKHDPPLYIHVPFATKGGDRGYLLLKRGIDLTIAILVIVFVLSWLFPILALLIRLNSKGGVLFVQKRVGLNGRVFNCIKFRTMYLNEEADTQETQANDDRITTIGKWLRFTYLDELPQLVNVLKGEMSIIGPRPHMLHHHNKFCLQIPSYNCRHAVKPGMTGLAQVKGYHGSLHNNYSIYGRTKLDLFYTKKISFFLDIYVLFQTISTLLKPYRKSK